MGVLAAAVALTAAAVESDENPAEDTDKVYTVPVTIVPTDEQIANCVILDNNQDGTTWYAYATAADGYFYYSYNTVSAADDWCFLPKVHMAPAKYKISWDFHAQGFPENFRLYIGQGTNPEDYTHVLMEQLDYSNSNYVTESCELTIEEEGDYRLALYAFSEKDKNKIYIQNIKIEEINLAAPLAPTDFEMTSNGFEGVFTLTLPTQNKGDEDMIGEVSAEITMDASEDVIATVTGAPGETVTGNVSVNSRGTHTFTAKAFVESDGRSLYSDPISITHEFTRVIELPLALGYTVYPDEDDSALCQMIDNNGDDKKWKFYSGSMPKNNVNDNAFRYEASWGDDADDWLILPQYQGSSNGTLQISYLAATKAYNETYEIAVGTSNDIETLSQNVVWNSGDFKSDDKFVRVVVNCNVPAGENFFVAFHATTEHGYGSIYLQDITIVESNPLIPLEPSFGTPDFDGGTGIIPLTLPTLNISDATIEGVIYADVTIDGDTYANEVAGSAGDEINLEFEGLSLGSHVIEAYAYVMEGENKLVSQTVSLNFDVKPGSDFYFTVPTDMNFSEAIMLGCVIIDNNNDGRTWAYDSSITGGGVKYTYSGSNQGDDWFFTPAILMDIENGEYDIQLSMRANSASFAERFEIFIGKEQTIEAMTIEVLGPTETSSTNYEYYGGTVTITEPGRYYVGVHAISDADKYYLYLKNMTVTTDSTPSGVDMADADAATVVGADEAVKVMGMAGETVTVYNMAGQLVKSIKVADNAEMIAVPAGLYVVKAADKAFKVVVK